MIKKIPMRKRFVTQCYFWFVSTNAPFPRIRTLLKPHFNPNRYSRTLRLRANGRNIVDQQLPTLLDVTCCVRLHTLLHVVGCCCAKFETGQTFRPVQTDATLLAYNSRHCWELLRRLHVALLWKAVSKRCSVSDWLISYGGKADSCRNICSFKNIRIRVYVAQVYSILQAWMIFKTQLHSLVYGLLVVIFWWTLSSSWRVHVCLIPLLIAVYLWSRQEYFSFQVRLNFNWVRV